MVTKMTIHRKGTKWSNDQLKSEALNYSTRKSFAHGNSGAYTTARRNGVIDLICAHMEVNFISWTNRMLQEEAGKYQSRKEFERGSYSAYQAAHKRGYDFFNGICAHMKAKYFDWTDEILRKEAMEYDTRSKFQYGSKNAYQAAGAKGKEFLDDICSHMKAVLIEWTDEMLRNEAGKYSTRNDFNQGNRKAYKSARHRGAIFFDDVCSHMEYAVGGFNPSKHGLLYYIKFESPTEPPLYKIGITNFKDVNKRIRSMYINKDITPTILKTISFNIGKEAYELERSLHKEYAEYKYRGNPIMQNGNTELFIKDVFCTITENND